MLAMILHGFSESLAVGLQSANQTEIIEQYYSLWNLKATGGKLIWLSPTFAFIWTTEPLFKKWLKDSSVRIYGNSVKEIKNVGKAKRAIQKLIKERTQNLKYENFVTVIPPSAMTYKVDNSIHYTYTNSYNYSDSEVRRLCEKFDY